MTKNEAKELAEIKDLLKNVFQSRYDPENGWKTARAVFEEKTVNALEQIHKQLEEMKMVTDQIPALCTTVDSNLRWRKKATRFLLWVGGTIGAPILGGVGYLIFRALTT